MVVYSAAFQLQAKAEIFVLDKRPACDRNDVTPQCSVMKTLTNDFLLMRDQCRALEG